MAPTRVMIVDDAVVVRRLLSDVISEDPDLEVVATAANGQIALDRLDRYEPDVIILDVEMPVMDGLATLEEIRRRDRRLPVIMFSTLTQRGATATLDALSRGANDYLTKPTNTAGITDAKDQIRRDLVPRVRALVGRDRVDDAEVRPTTPVTTRKSSPGARIDVLAIGVSTGGPNALNEVLPALPRELPVPVVVVQHMPPVFTRLLAERLDAKCALSVAEAEAGMRLEPGHVFVAPGDHHLEVKGGPTPTVQITDGPPENSCRPAVDVLFRSVSRAYGPRVLALVLTGMGHDGLKGSETIVEAGGTVLAQDQATSVVWGMPGYVAKAGIADRVLPLDRMAPEILDRLARAGRARREVA